jgi:tetratricopeptide (TPR) repeat protein
MESEPLPMDPLLASGEAYGTGLSYKKKQAWAEAAAWFQIAAELEPTNLAFYVDWGEALVKAGRSIEAVQIYERVATLTRDTRENGLGHYLLGGTLLRAGNSALALVALDQALLLNPALVEARGLRGLALARLGRHVAAREAFAETLAAAPGYLEQWPVAFEGAFLVTLAELRECYARIRED